MSDSGCCPLHTGILISKMVHPFKAMNLTTIHTTPHRNHDVILSVTMDVTI